MHAWTLAGLLGAAPFGIIIGNLRCKGCGQNVGVVLPWQAPTPRDFARINRISARNTAPPKPVLPRLPSERPADDFHYQLDILDAGGSVERRIALTDNLKIGHAAFDVAIQQYTQRPITLHARSQVLRHSVRPGVKPID